MPIPARILRAEADSLPGEHPVFSARDIAVQNRIVKIVEALATRHGCEGLTFSNVAAALRMSPTSLRRHYCDLPSIIAEIFLRHLRAISDAIGQVSCDQENLHAARRAAYAGATRAPYGGFTDLHALFLAEHHRLPPDLAEPLQTCHATIGHLLGAAGDITAITLLDTPGLEPPQIETIIAALETTQQPEPAPVFAPVFAPALQLPAPIPSPPIPLHAREGPAGCLTHVLATRAARRAARLENVSRKKGLLF